MLNLPSDVYETFINVYKQYTIYKRDKSECKVEFKKSFMLMSIV